MCWEFNEYDKSILLVRRKNRTPFCKSSFTRTQSDNLVPKKLIRKRINSHKYIIASCSQSRLISASRQSVSWKSIPTFGTRYTNFRRRSLGHVSYTLSITVSINGVLFHYAPHSDDLDYIQRRLVFIVRVVSPILVRSDEGVRGGEEGHGKRRRGHKKSWEGQSGETSRDRETGTKTKRRRARPKSLPNGKAMS